LNDLSINYYKAKQNNKGTILLIHGLCSSSKTWNKIIKEINDDFNIYTVDLPLHYKSLKYGNWDIFRIALLIIKYFKQFKKMEKLIIWGHSLGAAIAVIINLLNNNLVDQLILEAPYTYLNQTISEMIYSLIKGYSENSKFHKYVKNKEEISFYQKFKEIYFPIHKNTLSFLKSVFDKDILQYLNIAYLENKKKTLVIISRDDFVINYKLTHNYFNSLPNDYNFQTLEFCWHSPHFHQPENVANIVKKFIN
ncbi:MAG: alpha/beta hydrolase, partial [Ureaplasma sp.]|nr:alpha/beta hydrolase [Ureaplasma sp.]